MSLDACFRRRIIPVVWDPSSHRELIGLASCVFLQGGSLAELADVLDVFRDQAYEHLSLFVHIDLVAGLENSEAGIAYLARFEQLSGVVTVHHHLASSIRRVGLLSVVRLFLSDSRAVERGLSVVAKSRPDAIEILPAAVASKVAHDFRKCHVPRITGGLCRTEQDVREALDSGCKAVTSTRPELWQLNRAARTSA
jgi:glycerol uptake operon antiterminator